MPSIKINGGAAGVKASVSAGSTVTFTLDSTAGIRTVEWSILSTDETTTTSAYTIATSGSVGQNGSTTALTAGTAARLKVRWNGGNNALGEPDPENTFATAKFYVPTAAGKEVGCAGEEYESDAVTGTTGLLNSAIRAIDEVAPGGIPVKIVRAATAAVLPANTRTSNVLTANANGAFAAVDGVSLSVGDRFLVQNEGGGASHVNNGIYTLTTAGDGSNPWTATRATDWDASSELVQGTRISVQQGTIWGGKELVYQTAGATINSTAQAFAATGYAPADAQYLCLTANANLSGETALDAIATTVPFVSTTTTPISLSRTDAATAATVNLATVIASSAGTTAAGFGPSCTFQGKQGSGSTETMGRIECVWTDVTGSSEDTKWVLRARTAGAAVTAATVAEVSGTEVLLPVLAGAASRLCTASTTGALGTVSGTAGIVTVASSGAPTVVNAAVLSVGTVTNVAGVYNISALSGALTFSCTDDAAIVLIRDDATDSISVPVMWLERQTSGTPANGIGGGLLFRVENDGGNPVEAGQIDVTLTSVTDAAEVGRIGFSIISAGTIAERSGIDYRGVYDGPVLWPTALKTGTYAAAAWDQVLCDPSGGGFTVTVPNGTAALKGKRVGIKNYGTSTNTITIDTVTTNGIQGATTSITTGWGYVELECVGTDGWIIVSRVT